MRWEPRTYRDVYCNEGEVPLVECRCGRRQSADMMLDVRALPAEIRGDAQFICDACRERWHAEGRIGRAELAAALGAPLEAVERIRRRSALNG